MTIWALLRKFRRSYLSASKVYKKLGKLGPLSLQIDGHKVEGQGFQVKAENQVPDTDLITQLAILMYPLLDPHNNLYWQRVLAVLEERFAEEIPYVLREQLDVHARRLAQTSIIPIKFNNERLDPQQVYLQMARGFYFSQEPQALAEIERLLTGPMMGPILWNCFYNYTVTGFELSSALFNIFLELHKTATFQELYHEQNTGPRRCIYCRTSEAGFSSEEHVLPEGLGNDDLVLEKGYVCDPCNNGLLALLDQALLEFGPIAFLKVLYVPHGKGGKLPSANLQNMQIKKTAPTRN